VGVISAGLSDDRASELIQIKDEGPFSHRLTALILE
jgi:hypothetical protein